jgi:hypothetical protein
VARPLNLNCNVKRAAFLALATLLLVGCRGEPVPRDYQNAPPNMTDAPKSKAETPSGHGMGQAPPQPSTGVEGTAGPYEPVTPPVTGTTSTTVTDTPPVTKTNT